VNKDVNNQNKEKSKQIFLSNQLIYPNERVVAFLARFYKNHSKNETLKGLDVGCAHGRHIALLMDYGFQAYGVDYVEEACEFSRDLITHRGNSGEVYCGDFHGHYDDEAYDVIIALGVVFLRQMDYMKRDLLDLFRILKPGGRMFINFRTNEDVLFGKGERVDEYSFVLDERSKGYDGILYTFLSSEQASELLTGAGFSIEYVEKYELWGDNLASRHTWWQFAVRK